MIAVNRGDRRMTVINRRDGCLIVINRRGGFQTRPGEFRKLGA